MSDVSPGTLHCDTQCNIATSRDRTRRYRARLKRGHGKNIREKPLLERKKILKALMPRDPLLRYSDHVAEFGTREFAKAQRAHEEGVIVADFEHLIPIDLLRQSFGSGKRKTVLQAGLVWSQLPVHASPLRPFGRAAASPKRRTEHAAMLAAPLDTSSGRIDDVSEGATVKVVAS
jgi:hypothetical protein